MTYALVVAMNRAWAAVQRPSRSRRATILTMLWIFGGSRKLAPVQFLVAGNAERNPIANINYKFWKLRNRLYVVGVNIATFAAGLAGVIVSSINILSPFSKIALNLRPFAEQRFTAFPCRCLFACHTLAATRSGTENRPLVPAIKFFAAVGAFSCLRWIALRPTSLRAISRRTRAVCLDFVDRTASLASFSDLGVLHIGIIPHNTIITRIYCAIQRWVDMTGGEPKILTP